MRDEIGRDFVLVDDVLDMLRDSINIPGLSPGVVDAFYGLADAISLKTNKPTTGPPYHEK
jgi:hypothetical protein